MSAPHIQSPNDDDPVRVAKNLAMHSMWMGIAFMAIILVALVLKLVSHALISHGVIESNELLAWAIRLGEYGLLLIDVVLLIGVVGKLSWRLFKNS